MQIIYEAPKWFMSLDGTAQSVILVISFLVVIIVARIPKVTVLISPHAVSRARAISSETHLIKSSKILEMQFAPIVQRRFFLRGTSFACTVSAEIAFDNDLKAVAERWRAGGGKGPVVGIATCYETAGAFTTSSRNYND